MALAQAGELKAQCVLLGVGFLTRDPEHFFGIRSYRPAARRGYLLGQLDHSPGGCGRLEPAVLHAVEGACE